MIHLVVDRNIATATRFGTVWLLTRLLLMRRDSNFGAAIFWMEGTREPSSRVVVRELVETEREGLMIVKYGRNDSNKQLRNDKGACQHWTKLAESETRPYMRRSSRIFVDRRR